MRGCIARLGRLVVCSSVLGGVANAQTSHVWDGGGTNNNWSFSTNWNPNTTPPNPTTNYVALAGVTRLTPNVDTPWTIFGLIISNGAGGFTLGGSQLTFTAAGTAGTPASFTHNGASNVVINNRIVLQTQLSPTNRRTFTIGGAGGATFNGAISNSSAGLGDLHIRGAGAGLGTINGQIWLGTNSLFHTDAGTWVIGGAGNVWGKTQLDQTGTVRLAVNNALPTNTLVQFDTASPRLDLNNFSQTIGGMTGTGVVRTGTAAGGTLTIADQGGTNTFRGTIVENGRLAKSGPGAFQLSGINTFTNGASILGGTLRLIGTTVLASRLSNEIIVTNGATLAFSSVNAMAANHGTQLLSPITVAGGTLVCEGKENRLGNVTLNGGTMLFDGGSAVWGAFYLPETVTVVGASASIITNTATANGNFRPGPNTYFDVSNVTAGDDLIVYAPILGMPNNGGPGGFTKVGAGTMRLAGANAMSGTIVVAEGSVVVSDTAMPPVTNTTIAAGATLDLTDYAGGFSLASGRIIQGFGSIVAPSVVLSAGSSVLAGGDGVPGTLTITGSVLAADAAYVSRFDLTNSLTVGGGVNDLLDISGGFEPIFSQVRIRALAPLVSGSYRLINYSGSMTTPFTEPVLGNAYRDVWTLDTNTSGQVNLIVAAGTNYSLVWQPQASADWDILASANWTNTALGALDAYADNDIVLFDDSGASNVVTLATQLKPAAVTVNAAGDYTFTGPGKISDSFSASALVKDGAGTLTINTVNDYSGGTVVSNGTVIRAVNGALSSGSVTLLGNGALVDSAGGTIVGALSGNGKLVKGSGAPLSLTANSSFSGPVVISNGTVLTVNGPGYLNNGAFAGSIANDGSLVFNGATQVLAGAISGAGTLTVTGALNAGYVTLTNANTFSGLTLVTAGALSLGSTNGPALAGAVVFDNNLSPDIYTTVDNQFGPGVVLTYSNNVGDHGRLELLGTVQTLAGIQSAYTGQRGVVQNREFGPLVATSNSLLILDGAGDYSFGGYLRNQQGSLALTKTGSGSQNFYGTQIIYTGLTTVTSGQLVLSNATAFASAISNDAVVEFKSTAANDATPDWGYSKTLTGTGTVNKTGTGWFHINVGKVEMSGGQINVQGGILSGNTGGSTWTGNTASLDVSAGAVFSPHGANNSVFIGALTGSGLVSNMGPTAGTLTFGAADRSGTFSGNIGNNANALSLTKIGLGTQTLSGTNNHTGVTTVSGGTLAFGAGATLTSTPRLVLASGATLDISALGNFALVNFQSLEGFGLVTGNVMTATGSKVTPGAAGTAGTLTFGNDLDLTATTTNYFDLTGGDTTIGGGINDLIEVGGLLEPSNAVVAIASPAVPFANTSYRLFNYSGVKVSSFNPVVVGNLTRKTWTLDEATGGQVNLVVSGGDYLGLKWNAQTSANWDNNTGVNWLDIVGATNTTYLDGDNVLFDDSGAVTNAIALVGTLSPGSITVNSASNYTISGAGKISGATGLTKDGSGTLTLGGTGNDFTGPSVISNGTLKVVTTGIIPGGNSIAVGATGVLNLDSGNATYTNVNAISGSGTVLLTFTGATANNVYLTGVSTGFTGTIEVTPNGTIGSKLNSAGLNVGSAALVKVNSGAQFFFASGVDLANPIQIVGTGNNETRGAIRLATTNAMTGPVTLMGSATIGLEGGNISGDITGGVAGTNTLTLGTTNSAAASTFGGTISDGVGTLAVLSANGTATLSGTNTYTGGTRLNATVVAPAISDVGPSSIGTSGLLTFGGGTLRYTGTTAADTSRTVTNIGAANYDITNAAASLTLSGPISGPGLITKLGVGTLAWSNNTVTANGGWRIRQGTLVMDGSSYTNTTVNEEWLGNVAGDTSRFIMTNNSRITKTSASWFQIAAIAGSTGVMVMADGSFSSADLTKGFLLGNQANTFGAFYQLGGNVSVGFEFDVGYGTSSSYGFYQLAGGSLTNSSWQQAGRTGLGLIYLTGGNDSQISSGQGLLSGNTGTGVVYIANCQVSLAGRLAMGWVGTSHGEITIGNGSLVTVGALGVQFNQSGTTYGTLNLNGGTLETSNMYKQVAGGYSVVNFNGGLLRALGSQILVGAGAGAAGALDNAFVYGGGATIDSSNLNVTVTQPLRAPTGNGVTALPATGTLPGYLGAPYVSISGGGGTGATAIALFDYASGSVTGLVITSAGTDYASAPSVTLQGGGQPNIALGSATIAANTSGGLTKLGGGTLSLNAANTYTGATIVSAGYLCGTGSVAGAVTVNSGAAIGQTYYSTVTGTFTVGSSLTISNGGLLSAYLLGTNPAIRVAGDFNISPTTTVQLIAPAVVTNGTYVLVDYGGVFNGSISDFNLLAIPYGSQGYLTNNLTGTSIDLVVTNAGTGIKWNGLVDATWKNIGPLNWLTVPGGSTTAYSPLDTVLFDDTAAANFAVDLTEPLAPASVTISNDTKDYTFAGAGSIGGSASLTKTGAGTLTLATANGFTGGTVLSGGTLKLADASALGANGRSIALNGGRLHLASDTAVNTYSVTMGGSATVTAGRATSGGAITNILGALTATSGSYTLGVNAGTNVASGPAELVFGGTWSNSGQTTTFDIGDGAALTMSGGMPAGGQTVSVVKNGAGRLTLGGAYGTWDAGNAIALNAGALDLRSVPGDSGIFRNIVAASNTVLTLEQNANTTFYSGLTMNGDMTVMSDRIALGAGLTHSLGTLLFSGTNLTMNVSAGSSATSGTATVTFTGVTTLGSNSVINVTNSTGAASAMTLSGLVSGPGRSLTKTGSGTLTLSPPSPNNYTGGTVVNDGTLILAYGNGGLNLGTIGGTLTINTGATVRTTAEKALGFASNASGGVTVVTIRSGLLEHTGVNGMNGGQTVFMTASEIRSNGGTPSTNSACFRMAGGPDPTIYVRASSATSLFTGRIALDTTGKFDVEDGAADIDLLVASAMTDGIGAGNPPNGIIKSNAGTMAISGPNAYSRFTFIDGGTLMLGTGGTNGALGRGPVTNNARLVLNRSSGTVTNFITGTGVVVQTGSGAMELSAINDYSGGTQISNGTLIVNGAIGAGAVSIAAGATLGGTGTVNGPVTSAGSVAPGNSAGLLSLFQTYAQTASGSYNVEIGGLVSGDEHDQLFVAGTASLGGALNVSFINGYTGTYGSAYTVLVSGGGVSGTFATTNLPALESTNAWSVDYQVNAVILSITSAPSVAATGYDLAAQSITNGLTGYQDDADGDGYANLLEYVTGGNLTNADTTARMLGARVGGLLALQFTRTSNSVDTTLIVEGANNSTNGANWIGIATNIGGSWGSATNINETGGPSLFNVTAFDTDPATNRFLRLRITRP